MIKYKVIPIDDSDELIYIIIKYKIILLRDSYELIHIIYRLHNEADPFPSFIGSSDRLRLLAKTMLSCYT